MGRSLGLTGALHAGPRAPWGTCGIFDLAPPRPQEKRGHFLTLNLGTNGMLHIVAARTLGLCERRFNATVRRFAKCKIYNKWCVACNKHSKEITQKDARHKNNPTYHNAKPFCHPHRSAMEGAAQRAHNLNGPRGEFNFQARGLRRPIRL